MINKIWLIRIETQTYIEKKEKKEKKQKKNTLAALTSHTWLGEVLALELYI